MYGGHEGVHVIKFVGDVRGTSGDALRVASDVDAYLCERLHAPDSRALVIDLAETTAIDSTHLGILARVAAAYRELHAVKPIVVASDAKITQLLHTMGFDSLFEVAPAPVGGARDTALEPVPEAAARGDASNIVLDAHRALSDMNESNAAAFKDVLELLESQCDQHMPHQ